MTATLTGANVTFHTQTVPKNANSEIEIVVTDTTGAIAAQEANSYGPFAASSTHGPFPVKVLNQVPKNQLQPGGSLALNWLPNPTGSAWEFNFNMDLIFSDGSNIVVDQNGVFLDPAANQAVYGL